MSFFLIGRRTAMLSVLVLTALAGLPGGLARAAETIQITDAKARPTPPGATSGVVYLTVMNHGAADDTLTSVATSVADAASMHRTVNDSGIMKMEPVGSLPVKAGGTLSFAPGGLHIMLTGLKRPLKPGDDFPITLNFATAGPVTTTVAVGAIGPAAHGMHDMPGMKM